ncbi:hypothetical protein ERJ70_10905 [Sediminibacillus dalangtanensis]|uniref:Acetyl-coenzyme A carboxylase carboxyl transferase subunit beta domain-containing protein n=1 Tax=Sediminibacillus dalangtanensis TaxID=2729421 RepID=A0ABX7VZA0_9BACI|nr:carboxyl transferase domain-containing protein [Sediminibacillus dalangtanensis]QTM99762.1 hypothetical protein ERJ70_10905 [Sediminibacillus dalangtanensis]
MVRRDKRLENTMNGLTIDEDTFVELNPFVDPRVTDFGMADKGAPEGRRALKSTAGRSDHLFAQDFTIYGSALREMHAKKIVAVMDLGVKVM